MCLSNDFIVPFIAGKAIASDESRLRRFREYSQAILIVLVITLSLRINVLAQGASCSGSNGSWLFGNRLVPYRYRFRWFV